MSLDSVIIHTGDNREILATLPDHSIDAIVTDPPYGIDFLGKAWDANTGALETYQQCLRVLKPGGHILAFSAARTYHHLAVTLEQAGFEIRDQIMWIYSSGFPKSQDVGKSIQRSLGVKEKKTLPKEQQTSTAGFAKNGAQEQSAWSGETTVCTDPEAKQWEGWGTALKPAHEPICMARKPMKTSIAQNCLQWGVGALNIDATRVPIQGPDNRGGGSDGWSRVEFGEAEPGKWDGQSYVPNSAGRFPSNVIGDIPLYQKYFYCPKVSSRERHIMNTVENTHPTVKPIELMKYLIRLITPPGGTVLDPFMGSGSTGMAAVELGYTFVGCELDPRYVEIAQRRIEAWYQDTRSGTTFEALFESDR
jgi:site-specific DNA-methyltransferase (adenine-specific)